MHTQVKSWGNSQGIRLSKDVLEAAHISLDDILDIKISDNTITLVKQRWHKSLEERAAAYGGRLLLDGEYDWGAPVGREDWE